MSVSFLSEDLAAWQKEEVRLASNAIQPGKWAAIITYCLSLALFSFFTLPFDIIIYVIILFPAPICLLAGELAKKYPEKTDYFIHLIVVPIFISNISLLLYQTEYLSGNDSGVTIAMLACIPIFLTPNLLAFWGPLQAGITLLYGLLITLGPIIILQKTYLSEAIQMWLIVLPICVGGIIFVRFRYNFTKKMFLLGEALKRNQAELNLKNEQLSEKNDSILDSIRYAKRIQTSILPDNSQIQTLFPKSFIFYLPKDIVSGDLYCFSQVEDKNVLAVIDCTGHGVPGAFMSVIANNLFSQLTLERRITHPSEILNRMDIGVQSILKQNPGNPQQDGMDVCLCTFEGDKMYYAGANRKLVRVRNGELTEFSADKLPVGDARLPDKQYETVEIELLKGDRFYLYSDGITDQFGGETEKPRKLTPKRFLQFITENAHKPMNLQGKELQELFSGWKKTFPKRMMYASSVSKSK